MLNFVFLKHYFIFNKIRFKRLYGNIWYFCDVLLQMKLIIAVKKILSILLNSPDVMSGTKSSTNKYYLEFLEDYNCRNINWGSMAQDRANYSVDLGRVFNDYKRASLDYKKKRIGKKK